MFQATLTQMAVLAIYMIIGFIVAKLKIVPDGSTKVLSKLENTVFIPALVLFTFITNFTTENLTTAWKLLVFAIIVVLVTIPLAMLIARIATRDGYIQKIYTYGLSFSNFGFMGNAVVLALFPEYFTYYVIFTLPLWTAIYVWGAPFLLMGDDENVEGENKTKTSNKKSIWSLLKNLINPMFISLIIGAIVGISGLGAILPSFIVDVIKGCQNCMSPIAMIMTGMTFASLDFKKMFTNWSVYFISVVRLVVLPCLFVGLYYLITWAFSITLPHEFFVCLVASSAMPLGLNTIVIPAAYGKDVSVASGMALISHLMSIITIPILMGIFLPV